MLGYHLAVDITGDTWAHGLASGRSEDQMMAFSISRGFPEGNRGEEGRQEGEWDN